MADITITLLSNAGAGNGATKQWPGGRGEFRVHAGTWGGGNVKLQCLGPDGATWQDVGSDTQLTADGGAIFELGAGGIRAVSTTSTEVYADAHRLPPTP